MKVSVNITSRNRCEDLRRTLNVLKRMDPQPDEILVTADGCTDSTVEMLNADYPHIQISVNIHGVGSVLSRDKMIRKSNGDLILSLDDDSYPVDADFLSKVEPVMNEHPEAAVVTFPELCDDGFLHKDDPLYFQGHYVPSYPNCAALMRRDVYLKLGGFPGFFIHSYEEPDYAAQCAGIGLAVWFEPSIVIRHHYSPTNRNWLKVHQANARNELWSVWLRCPFPYLFAVALFRIWRQFVYAWRRGWAFKEPLWWISALKGMPLCRDNRSVVPWPQYLAWMKLARIPVFDRSAWEVTHGFKEPLYNHHGLSDKANLTKVR